MYESQNLALVLIIYKAQILHKILLLKSDRNHEIEINLSIICNYPSVKKNSDGSPAAITLNLKSEAACIFHHIIFFFPFKITIISQHPSRSLKFPWTGATALCKQVLIVVFLKIVKIKIQVSYRSSYPSEKCNTFL